MTSSKFTPTQQAMLDVLADGLPHTFDELHACLLDDLSQISTIQFHISNLRKVLRPLGQDIICEVANRRKYYRHIRLLLSEVS